jgi:hypothetical protein
MRRRRVRTGAVLITAIGRAGLVEPQMTTQTTTQMTTR